MFRLSTIERNLGASLSQSLGYGKSNAICSTCNERNLAI